jgi:hypothetical protein
MRQQSLVPVNLPCDEDVLPPSSLLLRSHPLESITGWASVCRQTGVTRPSAA